MIDELKKLGERKIQLIMNTKFILSKDRDHKELMHCKNGNIEIMIGNLINY